MKTTSGAEIAGVGVLVTRDDWAAAITKEWQATVRGIINVGKLLLGAKAGLPHGEFLPMIEKKLPFKRQTAFRLMTIAEHPILSNVTPELCTDSA